MKLVNGADGKPDWLLECATPKRAVFQMVLYGVHLSTGSSLKCKLIRCKTIKGYLSNVAKFLARTHKGDPRKFNQASSALAEPIA